MVFRTAHLIWALAAIPAAAKACGVVSGAAELASLGPAGDIALADGSHARFGGLALAPQAEGAMAVWIGRRVGVARFASRPDRWGRLVVDLVGEDGQSLALDLLTRGLARVRPEPETVGCEAERLDAEAAARAAGEGVWAEPGAVLDAADAAALAANDGRFVVVAGVVRRVGDARAKVYLDFARHGRFSVVVARKAEPQFRRAGVELETLTGRKVRVRGVLDHRYEPRIEIADPLMIEVLQKETDR